MFYLPVSKPPYPSTVTEQIQVHVGMVSLITSLITKYTNTDQAWMAVITMEIHTGHVRSRTRRNPIHSSICLFYRLCD